MKKTLLLLMVMATGSTLFAQVDTISGNTTIVHPEPINIKIAERGSDHLLIQYGVTSWGGNVPDSISTRGFSRHFNIYFLFDKPFRTNPKMSVAYGIGIGSDNVFFDRTYIDLKSTGPTLPFLNVADTNYFKKYKLTTVYLEAPVELRFSANPAFPNKGLKVALGAKVGTMIRAHTKGKDLVNRNGQTIYGTRYISKEVERHFFNGTRLSLTGRVGYGHFSLHGAFQVTQLLKENAGPEIRPFQIGLTISGL